MSRMSILNKLVGFGLNKPINPLTAIFAGQLGKPIVQGIKDDFDDSELERERSKTKRLNKEYTREILAKRLALNSQQATDRNLQFLKQNSPAVYDSVMAGRRLPADAIVLGGQPRTDLLDELARNMGSSPSMESMPSAGPTPYNSPPFQRGD